MPTARAASIPAPAARVEMIEAGAAEAHAEAWRDLAARALEPNVFAEPAFVLNGLRHLPGAENLRLLLVWQGAAQQRLIGAIVVQLPRVSFGFGVARAWLSEQAGLAALMLDRDAGEAALAAILAWLAAKPRGAIGLVLPSIEGAGPTARVVATLGLQAGAPPRVIGRRSRALLNAATALARGFEAALPKKRLKEWGRQMRRLNERGDVQYPVASDSAATEKFLALEARGWKGARHTALGAEAGLAAFTRAMLAGLAERGQLAIHLMELDGAPIAAGLMLRAGERAFYWKTAYDESYAEYSPGVQLTLALSRAQQRNAAILATDSCAIEGHPMIDRLWTGRLDLADYLIATHPGAQRRLAIWAAGEKARIGLRELAKRAINPLRGRKKS